MKVLYKREPVTVVKLTLSQPDYLNKPIIVQVKIKYKDGATDYANPDDIIWEPGQSGIHD